MTRSGGGVKGIACSIWAREIDTLTRRGVIRFPVRYFDSMLHIYPERLECHLQRMVEEETSQGRQVIVLTGDCCSGMCELAAQPGVVRVAGVNCCQTLLGKTEYARLLAEGAFFLLPEWARRWKAVFQESLGLDELGVKSLMGEMVQRLVYLDTGLTRVPVERLQEAAQYTGLPYEILKVELDHFGRAIVEAENRLLVASGAILDATAPRYPALSVIALDMLRNALAHSERLSVMAEYVTAELRELTGARTVALFRWDGLPGSEIRVEAVSPERRRHLAHSRFVRAFLNRLRDATGAQQEMATASGANREVRIGLPLRAGGETVGFLLLLGLPESLAAEEVRDTLAMLSTIMALVLRNALLHESRELKISQRTRELEKSEARLQLALESADEGIWEWEAQSPDLYISDRICAKLGRQAESGRLPREEWMRMIHPDDRPAVEQQVRRHLNEGAQRHRIEYRMQSAAGKYRWFESSAQAVRCSAGGAVEHLIGTLRDITAQKDLEEQLRQSVKMEAVGRLAGGVAHDFNNLLTVISGYGDVLLREMHESDPFRGYVEEIANASRRAASLTRQLLAFSRKEIIQPKLLQVNDEVRRLENMLRRIIGEDIELAIHLDEQLGLTCAGPDQIQQILMNLAVNARDAMPDGGRLTIGTSNVEFGPAVRDEFPGRQPGRHIRLSVADTGTGMDEATRRSVFEPFFTTKQAGKGTGLGLSTVYGSATQMGGWVEVESELGRGSSFRVFLPRAEGTPPAPVPEQREVTVRSGGETVLIVEDDPQVRGFTAAVLRDRGYTVVEAADGASALQAAEERPGGIHLLVSDVVLPGMNGRDVAERIRSLHPEIRCVFVSGYPEDVIADKGVLNPHVEYLAKPFSPAGLLRKVQSVLAV